VANRAVAGGLANDRRDDLPVLVVVGPPAQVGLLRSSPGTETQSFAGVGVA